MALSRYAGFDRASIDFLAELAANSNREWFNDNETRYEHKGTRR